MVSTHLKKYESKWESNLPQVRMKIKNYLKPPARSPTGQIDLKLLVETEVDGNNVNISGPLGTQETPEPFTGFLRHLQIELSVPR